MANYRNATSSSQGKSTTIEQYPLERRKITKKVTDAMIIWTVFLIIGIIITALFTHSSNLKTWLVLSLFVIYLLIFLIQIWYQTEYFKRYFYNISSDFLDIKKGVIMPHETMLPYEKLQDVYMDQDFFDRLFNLWDVHVSTATVMSGHEAHIDGVNRENAEKLRELILKRIRKEK